jgi:hypothetical protein
MSDLTDETATDRHAQDAWSRSQQRARRQFGLPVLAIWGAETVLIIAIVVMLATR